jgi:TolB-like protein
MKKLLVIAALLATAGGGVGDAVLPEKMDKNVAIGVTEKISEELVNSGRFMVLDRTTVTKTLEEIEFQMSGLVSDEDIRKAGDQLSSRLGAAFVVVARVSQVGDTFFISAKMVDVKTGEITAQASDESEGKIAVTLKIAQNVGRKLAAGVKETEKELVPAIVAKPKEKEPQIAAEPAAKPANALGELRSRVEVYYSQPVFFGETEDDIDYWGYSSTSFGLAMKGMYFVWKGLYVSASFTAMIENMSDGFFSWIVFEPIYDFEAGAGWGIPLGKSLQLTAGVHAGYAGMTWGDAWGIYEGDSYGGFCFGGDVGLDLLIGKSLVIGLRTDVTIASFDMGGGYSQEEGWFGLQLGVGWAY